MNDIVDYENYNEVSALYDKYRKPTAIKILFDNISEYSTKTKIPLKDLKILDAGCGTGNCIAKLLEDTKGELKGAVCLERNDGMLGKCKEKLSKYSEVKFYQESITDMKCFEDQSFDVVITNMVLHHLDPIDVKSNDYPNLLKALEESYRILKKDGLFLINTIDPIQSIKGFWFYNHLLTPTQQEIIYNTFAPIESYVQYLQKVGFRSTDCVKVTELIYREEDYYDINKPLNADFRKASSGWTSLNLEESSLKEMVERHKKLFKIYGNQEEFKSLIEKELKFFGQSTEIIAKK